MKSILRLFLTVILLSILAFISFAYLAPLTGINFEIPLTELRVPVMLLENQN